MRNANKSLKIPYVAMVMEVKKWYRTEYVSGVGSPPKVSQFFRFIGSIITLRS